MDYLQYRTNKEAKQLIEGSFKPYYKWITFNTEIEENVDFTNFKF